MNNYEMVYILNPALTEDGLKDMISTVEKLIEAAGGTIENTNILGKKAIKANFQRAKNITVGTFIVVFFSAEGKALTELNRKLGLQEKILKFSILHATPKENEILAEA